MLITLRQNKRAFVEKLDFVTSGRPLRRRRQPRERMGFPAKGPTAVITDLGILTPDPVTKELTLTSVHPGVTVEKVVEATGWPLKVAPQSGHHARRRPKLELRVLRDLNERTARAHAGQAVTTSDDMFLRLRHAARPA